MCLCVGFLVHCTPYLEILSLLLDDFLDLALDVVDDEDKGEDLGRENSEHEAAEVTVEAQHVHPEEAERR